MAHSTRARAKSTLECVLRERHIRQVPAMSRTVKLPMGSNQTNCIVLVAAGALALTATLAHGQATGALRGVGTASVVVSMNSYETTPAGIDLRLKSAAESRLMAAGLRVLATSQVEELLETSRNPVVRITLLALPVNTAGRQTGHAYSLSVQLTEAVRAPTSGAPANVELWAGTRLNVTGVDQATAAIDGDLRELLDQLLSAWRVANRPD
jgi:hypothetical protein